MGRWPRLFLVLVLLLAACALLLLRDWEGREGEVKWAGRHLAREDTTASASVRTEGGDRNVTSGARVAVYKERKDLVTSVCREYGLGRLGGGGEPGRGAEYRNTARDFPWPPEKSLMYLKPWPLLYCWIHKVASTSWSKVFLQLAGKKTPASRIHEATLRFAPKHSELPAAVSTSLVFTVVRHPFERLVSAFRDKFELANKYSYVYSLYASKVTGHRGGRPSFSQFVDYLLREPVQKYNDHWVPYWLHCHVCDLEYDIIGRMETLGEDSDFIASRSGLGGTNISLPWANRRSGGEQDSLAYFAQLDRHRLQGLYSVYKLDFLMFNYSAQPYFQLFEEENMP